MWICGERLFGDKNPLGVAANGPSPPTCTGNQPESYPPQEVEGIVENKGESGALSL